MSKDTNSSVNLEEALKYLESVSIYGELFCKSYLKLINSIRVVLDELDSPDKVESQRTEHTSENQRETAQWYINPDGYYPYCSNCNYEVPRDIGLSGFCPNCGYKMTK